ncbi:MetQ/NlpA family ABC transporter substrate-binding protein [Ureibacillus sp. NPDC094379]
MKKWHLLLILALASILLTACNGGNKAQGEENTTVKVGIRSSEIKTWDYIAEQAKKEGINLELVTLSAQVDPNQTLADGDIDINAFQHVAYLNLFNLNNGTDIQPIGTTIIAPLGLYSNKHDSLDDLKEGASIAVPNDPSNWGRALLLLQEHGLLTVSDDFDGNGGEDRIKENPKNLEIIPVEGATTPRVMDDTDFAIINNGTAVQAGLYLSDAIIHENETAKPFINVIAAKAKDVENDVYQKIVEIYQSEETAKLIEETYNGNFIPVKLTLEELSTWKEVYSYND